MRAAGVADEGPGVRDPRPRRRALPLGRRPQLQLPGLPLLRGLAARSRVGAPAGVLPGGIGARRPRHGPARARGRPPRTREPPGARPAALGGAAGAGAGGAGGGWILASGPLGAKLAAGCLLALGVGAGCVGIGGVVLHDDEHRHRSQPQSRAGRRARGRAVGRRRLDPGRGGRGGGEPDRGLRSGSCRGSTAAGSVGGREQAAHEFGPEQGLAGGSAASRSGERVLAAGQRRLGGLRPCHRRAQLARRRRSRSRSRGNAAGSLRGSAGAERRSPAQPGGPRVLSRVAPGELLKGPGRPSPGGRARAGCRGGAAGRWRAPCAGPVAGRRCRRSPGRRAAAAGPGVGAGPSATVLVPLLTVRCQVGTSGSVNSHWKVVARLRPWSGLTWRRIVSNSSSSVWGSCGRGPRGRR